MRVLLDENIPHDLIAALARQEDVARSVVNHCELAITVSVHAGDSYLDAGGTAELAHELLPVGREADGPVDVVDHHPGAAAQNRHGIEGCRERVIRVGLEEVDERTVWRDCQTVKFVAVSMEDFDIRPGVDLAQPQTLVRAVSAHEDDVSPIG